MQPIVLEKTCADGQKLEAIFLPEKGMNLISFKKGATQVIDQSTQPLFEERFAGLGALIGPHFHRRKPWLVPKLKDESLFPHIARAKAKGIEDPFSHGVGRYAPWKVERTQTSFKGVLTGKDLWNDVPLSLIEGQNFKMEFIGELTEKGLQLHLSIVSDTDSLVGIHYYYHLPNGKGKISSQVKKQYKDQKGEYKDIPSEWYDSDEHRLNFDLHQEADFTFRPLDPLKGSIHLETEIYQLITHYKCECEENCWQLYHPANASFVCIEPISAQDPKHPNLTVSSIDIFLEIVNNQNKKI